MMNSFDVIVIGLGGMGSAAAAHLASRGQKVLGLDRFSPPHDRGSSHGATRVIRQAYFEHPSYVPLLLRSYELWRELERGNSEPLLVLCGGLMMGASESAVVTGSLDSARRHGLAHEFLDAREIRRRYPAFWVSDGTVALFEREAGVVFCERAVAAHLRRAARASAELHVEEPVIDWQVTPDAGVVVRTARTSYHADQLVLTPGPWAPDFLADLAIPLRVERQVLFWFRPRDGVESFLPDRFPVYVWERGGGSLPYGFPSVDGPDGGVKVAFYRKPEAELCAADSVDRRVRDDDVEGIRAAVREFLPTLDGELLSATVCLYTLTPDLHFIIGNHPAHPQVKVAAGFSGHGFKFCTIVGEILADLVMQGRTHNDISLFDPSRRFN
jgi:sarcosine oxidase